MTPGLLLVMLPNYHGPLQPPKTSVFPTQILYIYIYNFIAREYPSGSRGSSRLNQTSKHQKTNGEKENKWPNRDNPDIIKKQKTGIPFVM
jgi:hypothetical protein